MELSWTRGKISSSIILNFLINLTLLLVADKLRSVGSIERRWCWCCCFHAGNYIPRPIVDGTSLDVRLLGLRVAMFVALKAVSS